MTSSDLSKIAAKLPLSESVRKLNAESLELKRGNKIISALSKAPETPRISTDEDRLNKLERAWLAEMRIRFNGMPIGIQDITLKLAFDCRFTADFSIWTTNGLTLFETKGFFRDDAKVKLQVAARMFPAITFILVQRIKGRWTETFVRP